MELVQRRMDESPLFSQWTYGQLPIFINPPSAQCTASTGEKAAMTINFADQRYMELFGLKLKEGRIWDNEKDQFVQYKFIINETAKRVFRIEDITKASLQTERRMF